MNNESGADEATAFYIRKFVGTPLHAVDELYQRAIMGAGAVPYSYDFIKKSYSFMGPGIEALIGYQPEEVTPTLWTEIIQESVMLGAAGGLSKKQAAAEINAGKIKEWRCDMRVLTRFGKSRWISDASVQELNSEGKPIASVGILQDITERKQAENSAVAFSELGLGLSSTTTLPATAQVIADIADKVFGWDAFYLHLLPPGQHHQVAVLTIDIIDGKRTEFTPGEPEEPSAAMLRVMQKGAELILKEGPDPDANPYGDTARSSAAIMRIPLHQRGAAIGVLALHSYTPQAYTEGNLRFLQMLADYCSGAFERIWAEETLKNLHKQLVDSSRQAGMAEVATSVLHNVGNVLNSVNISASVIEDKMRNSKASNLAKAVALMNTHKADLPDFLAHQPKGRELMGYLALLSRHLGDEQEQVLRETASLNRDIQHIKEIVAMQQGYARVSGVTEQIDLIDLIEDAIRLNTASIERHGVELVREFQAPVPVIIDKHKALQILVNLIRNAKFAVDPNSAGEKRVVIRVTTTTERAEVRVMDNGVGIPAENLRRIFAHGFTTRKEGHGFGLHSGALAAKEMGGSLTALSDGPGCGATFLLEFPLRPPAA